MTLVQKDPLFNCLATAGVMLERSEASQSGANFDLSTFLHLGHLLLYRILPGSRSFNHLNYGIQPWQISPR
jgi:hypothetical protein